MRSLAEKEKDKSLKAFMANMLKHWYVFIVCFLVFIALAFVYLKRTTPQYEIKSTIMLKDEKGMSENKAVTSFANDNGLSFLLNPSENVMNEIKVLTSRRLAKEVVQQLKLNIVVATQNGLRVEEIYGDLPFDINIANAKTDSIKERQFELEFLDGNQIRVKNDVEDLDTKKLVKEKINTSQFDLLIQPLGDKIPVGNKYYVTVISENEAANRLLNNCSAELTDKTATTVNLQFYYPNARRGELILQTLMDRYILNNQDQKIRMADSALVFIDQRLESVAGELQGVELGLEKFRSSNQITDLTEQSKMLVGNASEYYNRLKDQEIQLKSIKNLETFVKDPANNRIPSSMNIQNASFQSSLQQYNALLLEYEKKKLSYTDSNPVLINLKNQIDAERSNLLQNIGTYKRELQVSSEGIGNLNKRFNNQIGQVPGKERQFVEFSRQQALKQQLYVYLLQKREEANIARNANVQSARIVDFAKSSNSPVKPLPIIIYMMGGILGLIIPFSFLNAKELLRTKVNSESDIGKYTDIEVIGKISHNSQDNQLVIGNNQPNSIVSEGFRSLRANLYYALQSRPSNVVMVTSTIKGEGKTFMTVNLGKALSLTGKKVVFVELDLRKPKLASSLGLSENIIGFTDVVQNRVSLKDAIVPCDDNCYLLAAGTYSDNPSELLLDERVEGIFKELRENYDYIIVDSPPVGLVSDALIIKQYVEMTVYVVRHNYTKKEQFDFINELRDKNKLSEMYLVVNDVNFRDPGYFAYGYGYGYDYEDQGGRKWLRKKNK
ncbi:GumC family protein [Olivibacter domesticus]|uniref:non-specific protein-tyrosine kinase n=1 Tax=Olivibacter domesticus TaxID=407022 RepID=A0A1H7YZG8_OLID1|nr:tyrosine-protein kinase [Olivibacter domesticus]SEM50647.1 capsular exopolysaccharide family [Olivibacter domesticus]